MIFVHSSNFVTKVFLVSNSFFLIEETTCYSSSLLSLTDSSSSSELDPELFFFASFNGFFGSTLNSTNLSI